MINREIDGTAILFSPGTSRQRIEVRTDAFANHFMEEPSSLAFGAANTFGTCQESRNTYNDLAPANDFMGPSLWPADLDIYARVNQRPDGDLGGSHLDMLHGSPLAAGIAYLDSNLYFVLDGCGTRTATNKCRGDGHVVLVDFNRDHQEGTGFHGDGVIDRFLDALVFPVGAGPEFGMHYLDAIKQLHDMYPDAHLFGGHSNVSFGLPDRKTLNDAFLILSILAGCDTLMVDPLMNAPKEYLEFKLAAAALMGVDEYSLNYLAYFRSKTA